MYEKLSSGKYVVVDRREDLRVKVKTFAAEARIIRQEELKTYGVIRDRLHMHRVHKLRKAARASNLAYGFIKGRTLEQMEPIRTEAQLEKKPYRDPPMEEVRRLCRKYGPAGYNGPPR